MLHLIFGVFLLAGTAFLMLKYRPKKKESLLLCAVCGGMGIFSLLFGAGIWWLQIIQHGMQVTAFGCCVMELRREKASRVRAAKARAAARRKPERDVTAEGNILYPRHFVA